MVLHLAINERDLRSKIRKQEICFGGNRTLNIYGTLQCQSGKRMKRESRVFFASEKEALQYGFRPCGHCMKQAYHLFKAAKATR